MLVIYSDKHVLHAPKHEFIWGRMVPFREAPVRGEIILKAIQDSHFGQVIAPQDHGMGPIEVIHDQDYLQHLKTAYKSWISFGGNEEGVFPDSYPIRQFPLGYPKHLKTGPAAYGNYQFDTSAVIVERTWEAAYEAAQVALTGASKLIQEQIPRVFSLCRPPGHHSDSDLAGGYCFLNNAGIAAQYMIDQLNVGNVAILDIDYHHGNGTQQLFYTKSNPLYVSLHGKDDYPFYWGSEEEKGSGDGTGFNANFPLPAGTGDDVYLETLRKAIKNTILPFNPNAIVISLGVDTFQGDPIGAFSLTPQAFVEIGELLKTEFRSIPTLFVMEGGYNLDHIGELVLSVLRGKV